MKTANPDKLPVPPVLKSWYELRMYFLGRSDSESTFFKASCSTEALNEARQRAQAKKAFHFDVGPTTIQGQLEVQP
jgi:hypothetical protein